jgi:hypothetical protein
LSNTTTGSMLEICRIVRSFNRGEYDARELMVLIDAPSEFWITCGRRSQRLETEFELYWR